MNYSTNYNLRLPDGTDDVDVSDISYDMEQIDEIMKANADGLSDLQTALGEDETDIGNLKDKTDALETSVGGLEDDMSFCKNKLQDLDEQLNKSPGGLDDEVADLKTDVSSLKTRMTTAEGSLTSLQGTVSGLSTDLDSLESTVAGHTTDITGIGGAIDRIDGDIVTINGKLTTDEATIATHTSDISDLKAEDVAIDGRLDVLETKKYKHTVVLHGTLAGYVTQVMFEIINEDDQADNSLNHIFPYLEDWTICQGLYLNDAFQAIKVVSNKEVHIAVLNHSYTHGYEEVTITASGQDNVFYSAFTLSVKEI